MVRHADVSGVPENKDQLAPVDDEVGGKVVELAVGGQHPRAGHGVQGSRAVEQQQVMLHVLAGELCFPRLQHAYDLPHPVRA